MNTPPLFRVSFLLTFQFFQKSLNVSILLCAVSSTFQIHSVVTIKLFCTLFHNNYFILFLSIAALVGSHESDKEASEK